MAMNSRRAQWVVWNDEQGLSDSEKLQARNNIGAAALASLAASFESRAPGYVWSAGEVCTYGGKLWMFDSNHSGAWTGVDVHEVTILEYLGPQFFKGKTKSFSFNLLPKYQSYFGTFKVSLKYNYLTGLYVVTGSIHTTSNFTPYYNTSDPAGSSPWPCVAELDLDKEPVEDASVNFLFGDIISPTPYINIYRIQIKKTDKKAFLIMSSNKSFDPNYVKEMVI